MPPGARAASPGWALKSHETTRRRPSELMPGACVRPPLVEGQLAGNFFDIGNGRVVIKDFHWEE
jgi:hypothetical protein